MKKVIRVLHCPTNTGNHPWALSRAERQLGIQSDLLIFDDHKYYQNYDKNLQLNYSSVPGEIKKWKYFKKIIKNYDIFHFNWGFSFLDYPYIGFDYLDFKMIKKAGKKIVMTFQGSDARQKDYFLKHFGEGPFETQEYGLIDKLLDWRKRKRIEKVAKYADKIYALNPDLLHVLPKTAEFLPYAVNTEKREKKIENRQKIKEVTIVHAPSHRYAKGTDYIIQIINKLKKRYPIKFMLVENLKNDEAQKIYDLADIAIDQLLVGWYGAFAVEMMAKGVPVLAYIREEDVKKYVHLDNKIPVVNVNKAGLESRLRQLIGEVVQRKKIGQESINYIKKYHSTKVIAKKTLKLYNELLKIA